MLASYTKHAHQDVRQQANRAVHRILRCQVCTPNMRIKMFANKPIALPIAFCAVGPAVCELGPAMHRQHFLCCHVDKSAVSCVASFPHAADYLLVICHNIQPAMRALVVAAMAKDIAAISDDYPQVVEAGLRLLIDICTEWVKLLQVRPFHSFHSPLSVIVVFGQILISQTNTSTLSCLASEYVCLDPFAGSA